MYIQFTSFVQGEICESWKIMMNVCMQIHWLTYQMNKYFLKVSNKDTLGCYFQQFPLILFSAQCCGTSNVWKIFFSLNSKIERKLGSERRLWQIKFLVIHVHVLFFSNICSLTYFHIKIFVLVHEAKNTLIPCKRKLFW